MNAFNNNYSIICVDDQEGVLEIYRIMLSGLGEIKERKTIQSHRVLKLDDSEDDNSKKPVPKYNLFFASSGEKAVEIVRDELKAGRRIAVGFFDMIMPGGMDGKETIKKIFELDDQMLCAIVTAYTDWSTEQLNDIFKNENNWLFLKKPFSTAELQQAAHHLISEWNHRRFEELEIDEKENIKMFEQKLVSSAAIHSLASLAELRDTDTGTHLKRVAEYCRLITHELAKESKWCTYITEQYINDLVESSVLHDIGKVGIPDSILLKPGKLSDEEFGIMKSHSKIGGDVLSKEVEELGTQSFLTLGREIAYYHHEKYNGTGYPEGLKGEDIPLSARILALADVYDALTSDRPYRKAFSHEKAVEIIVKEMGPAHFDPAILEVFQKAGKKFDEIRKTIVIKSEK